MSKKLRVFFALAGLCALSLLLLSCGSSSSRPSGLLYVLTEGTTGVGTNISSFSLDLNSGALSLINSNASTCNPAGNGCGAPLDILLDPTGADAFVLNQGVPGTALPTIYPYTINSDGSFSSPGTAVSWNCIVAGTAATPCTTGNSYPDVPVAMVRDSAGQFIFVIDEGSSPAPTTCPLVGQGVNNGNDAVNFSGCPSISVFSTAPGSNTLTFVSQSSTYQSPFFLSRVPTGVSPLILSSPAEEVLFVSSDFDLSINHNDNTVSVYSVSSTGALAEEPNSPYATTTISPMSVLAVNTNQTGTGGVFVYSGAAGNSAGAIDLFTLCITPGTNCSPTDVANAKLVPSPLPPTTAGQNPVQMLVDPTNSFLYSLAGGGSGSNQLYGFQVNSTSGKLTALTPAYEPTGSQPFAMALHPIVNNTGQFIYVSNSNSSNITGVTVSPTSGSMSSPITVTAPSTPTGIAAR